MKFVSECLNKKVSNLKYKGTKSDIVIDSKSYLSN